MELSDLLAPLDWGRQSLTNLGEGGSGLLSGDLTRQNFAKVAPGVGGILAGLLTGGVAAPFVGTGIASLLQGAGNQIAPQAMKAMSTQDIVGKLGGDPNSTWQNIGVGALTDPWTYALGAGGLRVGEAGLARAGKALDTAALARGPGFVGNDLGMFAGHGLEVADKGGLARAASEIPTGSSFLGEGAEARVFKTPSGRTVRVGMADSGVQGRPISSSVLQADRTVAIPAGEGKFLSVEHTPLADSVANAGQWHKVPGDAWKSFLSGDERDALRSALEADQLKPLDMHLGNLGRHAGVPVVIDPGAITQAGGDVARQSVINAKQPGFVVNHLLNMLGSDQKLQAALAAGSQDVGLAGSIPSWLKYAGIPAGASLPSATRGILGY